MSRSSERELKMSLLIAGAGLIGSQVARLEQEAGRTPVLFDLAPNRSALADFLDLDTCVIVQGDLLNPLDIVGAVQEHGISRIAHSAAFPNLMAGGLTAPLTTVQVNILGTANLLEVARLFRLEKVVLSSSSAVYVTTGGDDKGVANCEEAWPRPASIYGVTKQAIEGLSLNYRNAFGLQTICLRFGPVFGPWAGGGGGGGMATKEMDHLVRAGQQGLTVEIDPIPREWVYSKDAALAVHLACWEETGETAVFNVGSGRLVSVDELVEAVSEVFPGTSTTTATIEPGPLATPLPAMDSNRAKTVLGFAPRYSMKAALADYKTWLESAPSQCMAD
jgi:nucleoside-diphosphate-sugar epimerase